MFPCEILIGVQGENSSVLKQRQRFYFGRSFVAFTGKTTRDPGSALS